MPALQGATPTTKSGVVCLSRSWAISARKGRRITSMAAVLGGELEAWLTATAGSDCRAAVRSGGKPMMWPSRGEERVLTPQSAVNTWMEMYTGSHHM